MSLLNDLAHLLSGHSATLNSRPEGPRGTSGGALPPQVVDSPQGRVSYLSTLSNPQERHQTLDNWQRAAPPITPLPYDATGLNGNPNSNPGIASGNIQVPTYRMQIASPDIQGAPQNPGLIPFQSSRGFGYAHNLQNNYFQ